MKTAREHAESFYITKCPDLPNHSGFVGDCVECAEVAFTAAMRETAIEDRKTILNRLNVLRMNRGCGDLLDLRTLNIIEAEIVTAKLP
jgi:hypothetical protein